MNELRQQINSQLKASGVSTGIQYKSFQNQPSHVERQGTYTSQQSNKNIMSIKSSKVAINTHKRTEASDQQLSQVINTNESLQMKINKKRIQSSNKNTSVDGQNHQIQQQVPVHHRIVSNPISFNHENLAQAQQIKNKSRKNLSSQQSQSKLRGVENPNEVNQNPTQQILKLRAQALVQPQNILQKNQEKDSRKQTQVGFVQQTQKVPKREVRQNQQKMAQILAMENNTQLNQNQNIAQQILMSGLNTINNDVNSRQEVHEHNIGNPVGPVKKGNHNKAFSMSTYVLQKQVPKTQVISAQESRLTANKIKSSQGTKLTMHQKSQSTFNGQMMNQGTFDARKTYQNNMTTHSQAFSNNSMAKLIQSQQTGGTMIQKKKVTKTNQQMYMPSGFQQAHGNTVGGPVSHNLHRRIMSQQNPTNEQSQANIEQYINQQDIQNTANLGTSGKIVVINNNNTNINIHHQSPYQGAPGQYSQIVKKQQVHKKNTQSFNIPSTHQQQSIRTPVQAVEGGTVPTQQMKAYTYVNSTIKNSINNSLNQGILSHDQLNTQFEINNFVGEDEIRSNQLSPEDKRNLIPMSQKTFKKIQTSNVPSIYSNQQNRKQHLKRGALESRVKGSHVATTVTNPTNPSVASNGVPPSQGSNTNIKYTVQSQMQLAHQQKLYQGGGITSVGSASSIGDKIEKIEDKPIKGKTRQHSQNKSATRGKSSHIASREMIVDSRANNPTSNNGTQMRQTLKNLDKKQDQVQMHQGDISSSNFLNSERSSINQKKGSQIQPMQQVNQQSTIQYQNTHKQQNNYLQMFHNTEDNRRPQNAISEQSVSQLQTQTRYGNKQNTLSQDKLINSNMRYVQQNKSSNMQVQDSYFNVVNNSIINTSGATRGINHQKTKSMNSKDANLSNGQKQLQKMLSNNISKLSPNQQYKNANQKQTNTTKSHQRGSSVNINSENSVPGSSTNKASKKMAVHRKVESHDQAILEQMKQNNAQYYAQKHGPSQSEVQSYANYSNSENIQSDKYRYKPSFPVKDDKQMITQQSQLSNRQKMQHLEKSVPRSEISLQGTIGEAVPNELKNIPQVLNSPTKNQFPQNHSNLSSDKKKAKGSPLAKSQVNFYKKTVIYSDETAKSKSQSKKDKINSQINSGPLTPKKLIYNSILANIREKRFETKIEFYKIGKVIGKGAFGKVNLAIHRLTGKFVALKSINKSFMKDENSLKKVRQEYNILKRARHPNIVRLYESFEIDSHIVYVMEVCGGGDLLTYVRRRRKLKEEYAKFIFRQVIKGLQYVHHKGVLHRDIKLDNILLTSEGDVKICDFGVSKLVQNKNQTQTEQCGTPAYIAPEVFKGKGYKGFQSDVWSAGVVLYAMLYGTVPFKATNMHELQSQIINLQCSWGTPGEISPAALTMLKKVLEVDPNKRLTPQEILNEPWMQLTDKQLEEIEVFNDNEKQKIVDEFLYYNEKKEDMKDDPFLEQELQTTQNSDFKNNTTKSIILAPFNSTRSHISDGYLVNEGILPLIVKKEIFTFADKCKEVNRQYMLNNNAELDNGVYNENEEEEEKKDDKSPGKPKEDDGLLGMNVQIEHKSPQIINSGSPSQPRSKFESQQMTAQQSLNTSQVILDEDKIEKVCDLFGYEFEYVKEQLENDELNHATTCYFLIDQQKEF